MEDVLVLRDGGCVLVFGGGGDGDTGSGEN